MPMGLHDTQMFEIVNAVKFNVFQCSKGDLLPIYVSINRNSEPTIDFLLLYNKDLNHYVVLNNLSKLGIYCQAKTEQKHFASLQELLAFSQSEEQNQVHDDACRNHAPGTIMMPGGDK